MTFWRLSRQWSLTDSKSRKVAVLLAILGIIFLIYQVFKLDYKQVEPAKLKTNWKPKKKFTSADDPDDPLYFNPYKATKRHGTIAIVVILTSSTDPADYDIAIKTTQCYAKIHGYDFILAVDTDFDCHHRDKFFRRHCAVAKLLPLYSAILFIDADIGVINPERKIEEFMDERFDVIFYDRFYNWEIMAGSYIARNTQYAVDFLNEFANYESKLPNSFHGTDNGALHIFLAEKLFPLATAEIESCRQVYNKSANYADLFTYEACIRAIMGAGTDFGKIRVMKKGTGWARDCWLTNGLWHPELDFMLHEMKTNMLLETPKNALKPGMGANWYNPFLGPIDVSKCNPENSTWSYDPRVIGNKQDILDSLDKSFKRIAKLQVKSYSRIIQFLNGSPFFKLFLVFVVIQLFSL